MRSGGCVLPELRLFTVPRSRPALVSTAVLATAATALLEQWAGADLGPVSSVITLLSATPSAQPLSQGAPWGGLCPGLSLIPASRFWPSRVSCPNSVFSCLQPVLSPDGSCRRLFWNRGLSFRVLSCLSKARGCSVLGKHSVTAPLAAWAQGHVVDGFSSVSSFAGRGLSVRSTGLFGRFEAVAESPSSVWLLGCWDFRYLLKSTSSPSRARSSPGTQRPGMRSHQRQGACDTVSWQRADLGQREPSKSALFWLVKLIFHFF